MLTICKISAQCDKNSWSSSDYSLRDVKFIIITNLYKKCFQISTPTLLSNLYILNLVKQFFTQTQIELS